MLVLTRADVESLLEPAALIDAVAAAMADLSAGRASMPNRVAAAVPERSGLLLAMPASVPSLGALSAKLVTLFPQNAGSDMPTHQALIVAFDPATGAPSALLDGTAITALRTAACSAVSVRHLARAGARVLTIVGTGVQAAAHLRCVPLVRSFDEVRVVGRSRAKAEALSGGTARVLDSVAEALDGADVVCATTHPTTDPVIRRELLSPGAHVVSVGFDVDGIEVDAETVADALVVVESREATLAPPPSGSRDLAGVTDAIELGELVAGTAEGRTSDDQITLYKSVGVAVQDAAAAALVLERAAAAGVGTRLG